MNLVNAKLFIIGSGPAGISAALYAKRGGAKVTILTRGEAQGALDKASMIENYYGFAEPISGADLQRQGIAGAKRLGVQFIQGELLSLLMKDTLDGFKAITTIGEFQADAVILAMGTKRTRPQIKNFTTFEGHGVSYCAICDAFFYRGKKVAVLGAGNYALHEASVLLPHVQHLTLLTNGKPVPASMQASEKFTADMRKVQALEGDNKLAAVRFDDGETLAVDGLFIAIGTAGATEIAKKLGVMLSGTSIRVNQDMATNVPGVFAAGDATGGLLQIVKAVYEGAVAGLSALKFLKAKK